MYVIVELKFPDHEMDLNSSSLLYSSALHQHTDDNVPGTNATMFRVQGV